MGQILSIKKVLKSSFIDGKECLVFHTCMNIKGQSRGAYPLVLSSVLGDVYILELMRSI